MKRFFNKTSYLQHLLLCIIMTT